MNGLQLGSEGDTDDAFLVKHKMRKGTMQLIDEAQAATLYDVMGPAVEVSGEVMDETGNHRLVLRFARADRPVEGGRGLDFHSLAWEARAGGDWTERAVISRDDFQKGFPRRR